MAVSPILPTDFPTLPVEFLRAVNDRFRELSAATTAAAASGSSAGLFFRHAARPDANGTPVGTFGYEIDTGRLLQVETVGSAQTWVNIVPLYLDNGTLPASSLLLLKANALGALSLNCHSADDVGIGLDAEYSGSAWVARHAAICILHKSGSKLNIYGSTGNTVGSAPTLTLRATIDLATGDIDATTGVYKKGGTQVVTSRQVNIPTVTVGGTTDTNARATIASILSLLQAHGLMA